MDVIPSFQLRKKGAATSAVRSTLALLDEEDVNLREHALRKLYTLVDSHWSEAADSVAAIESLADAGSKLAAAVASKVYYHLEAYTEAVRLALAAGDLFDVDGRSEYVETIVARCIDEYTLAQVTNYQASLKASSSASAAAGDEGEQQQEQEAAAAPPAVPIDPRLAAVVDRMFSRCFKDGSVSALKQALGVALESRRLDMVVATVKRAVEMATANAGGSNAAASAATTAAADRRRAFIPSPGSDFLAFTVDLATATVAASSDSVTQVSLTPDQPQQQQQPAGSSASSSSFASTGAISPLPKEWRLRVLRALETLFVRPAGMGQQQQGAAIVSDYGTYARVLQSLDDAESLSKLLVSLLHEGVDGYEASHAAASGASASSSESSGPTPSALALTSPAVLLAYQVGLDAVESDDQAFLLQLHQHVSTAVAGTDAATLFSQASSRLLHILDGSLTTAVTSDFLSHRCAADQLILTNTKKALDARNSILHNALVVSHSLMYAGTSIDSFLRGNLDWLAKASNWNKFTAAASQGVVHRGRLGDSFSLLESYLPKEGEAVQDPYAEGGALFALGLIHANRGAAAAAGVVANPAEFLSSQQGGAGGAGAAAGATVATGSRVTRFLHDQLKNTMHEVMQHGSCLGLGTAAMGTGEVECFNSMRDVLFSEKAVASEGAALGIGLLLTGKGPGWTCETVADEAGSAAGEMLAQAHDTAHEKTIRGIGLALALMCYGCEESADGLIRTLSSDKDAVLRYGGMFCLALAYCGTGSNAAVRHLLHAAVTDVSDDVRRAAVLALGFVLCRNGKEVPSLVSQLSESFNPHVRYGAALAVGIACAGSGMPDAVALLEPLTNDTSDFVRQGALLALGLVLQQEAGAHLPKAAEIRARLITLISDRHTSSMTKMGAVLAQGIIDAGGRNAITSLVSRSGFLKQSAVVGMALWLQHWYWFPCLHFLSLALTPTPLVGLTGDFNVPTQGFNLTCKAPASWFAYPPKTEEKSDDPKAKVQTLELSTTAKAKAKAAAQKKQKDKAAAGAGDAAGAGAAAVPTSGAMDTDDSAAGAGEKKEGGEGAAMAVDGAAAAAPAGEKKEAKVKEPSTFTLSNPSRVTLSQAKFVDFSSSSEGRYVAVRPPVGSKFGSGIFFLLDAHPGEKDAHLVPLKPPASGAAAGAGDEAPDAPAPEPFDWVIGQYY